MKGLLLLFFLSWPFAAYSQTEASIEQALSLKEALQMALEANLNLEIERLQPAISRLELESQRSQYGLLSGGEISLNQDNSPSATSFISGASVLNQFRQDYQFFLEQNLASGGQIRFNANQGILNTNSNRSDFNPAISPSLSVAFSHPLLRNAWNGLRELAQRENSLEATRWELKNTAIETVAAVQNHYWGLVLNHERVRVLKYALGLLEDLLVMNQETEKAGFMSRIDVLQTEARIAAQKANLLNAQLQIDNTEDQLKQLLAPNTEPEHWAMRIKPSDQPEFKPYTSDLNQSFERALRMRPDYQSQLRQVANAALSEEIAQQNRLPALDFRGNAGLESLDSDYPQALSKLFSFQTYGLSAALRFEIPIVGNPYQLQFEQAQLQHQQARLRLENLRQQIWRELRQAVRNVNVNAQLVDATRLAKRLAEEQLKAQTEKLNLGLSTNFQVLQFQSDFVSTSLDEINAIIDYIQAVNQLQQAEGSLLEAIEISWEHI